MRNNNNMANELNNNNYIPGFPSPRAAMYTQGMSIGVQFPGVMQHNMNSFTFTSPTQCITTATSRPSIQTTSPMNHLSAPGVGASWQHSIPSTVSSPHMPFIGPGSVSHFKGVSPPKKPIPSCSSPVKRPKRKAQMESTDSPSSKVKLCVDKFENLHISPVDHRPHISDNVSRIDDQRNELTSNWQHFHKVEQRLDEELEEDTDYSTDPPDPKPKGPLLKVVDGVLNKNPSIHSTKPLLPKQVISEVQKSSMQLMLWQAPGATIRSVLTNNADKYISSSTEHTKSSTQISDSSKSKDNIPSNESHHMEVNMEEKNIKTAQKSGTGFPCAQLKSPLVSNVFSSYRPNVFSTNNTDLRNSRSVFDAQNDFPEDYEMLS